MERIVWAMPARESSLWGRVGLRLMFGLPLMILVPFVASIVLFLWFGGFMFWLLVTCIAWGWWSRKQVKLPEGKSAFVESVIARVGSGIDLNDRMTCEEAIAHERKQAANAWRDRLFHGPREVFEAVELIREQRQFSADQRKRAAEIIQELSKRDTGIPWQTLQRSGENLDSLFAVLGYLLFNEWVDMGGDGKKIWLLSDARKELMR